MRAIAAIMVVITHAAYKVNQLNVGNEISFGVGGFGVDLFFIISGFVIFKSISGRKIIIKDFLFKRIIRIVPLYWVVTTVALCVYMYDSSLVNSSGGGVDIIKSYFLIPGESKFLIQNGWTLSYEIYFYILMALMIFLFKSENKVGLYLFLLLNVLFFVGVIFESRSYLFKFITSHYLIEFSLGMAAYFFWKWKYVFSPKYGFFLIVVACFLMYVYEKEIIIVNPFLISSSSAFLIFFGGLCLEPIIKDKKNKLLIILFNLGSSSYSLYLFHPFCLSATFIAFKYSTISFPSYIQLATFLFVSLLCSHVIYLKIELPITQLLKGKKINNRVVN